MVRARLAPIPGELAIAMRHVPGTEVPTEDWGWPRTLRPAGLRRAGWRGR